MSRTLVGVYWNRRAESLDACVARTAAHFRCLTEADPALRHWFALASRKPKTPRPVDISSAIAIQRLLEKGVNRNEMDRSVIAELGWSLSLWNGDEGGASAGTSVHCNCTTAYVSNSAYVSISREDGAGLEDSAAIALLKKLIDVWAPDRGVVTGTVWNAAEDRGEDRNVATFERRRFPWWLPANAFRHAGGIITT